MIVLSILGKFMKKMQRFEAGVDKSNTGTPAIRARDPPLEAQGLNAIGCGDCAADLDDRVTNGNRLSE
ncbi:MAG: hypothetical protein ABFE02_01030 [Sulfuricella sp.]